MTAPLPTEKTQVMRIALIIAISVVAALLVGMGLWAIFRPQPKQGHQTTFTPAEETTASARTSTVTPSAAASETSGSTGDAPADGGSSAGAATLGILRAPKVAYRLNGAIYVAGEDGSAAKAVAQVPEGPYALSPDGRILAVVNAGQLQLVGVSDGKVTGLGAADAEAPVWMPDSSAMLFVRTGADGAPSVLKVPATDGAVKVLGAGAGAAVSPDGNVVVLLGAEDTGAAGLSVSRGGGAFSPLSVDGTALDVAVANDRVFVSTLSESGEAGVYETTFDGVPPRRIVAPASGSGKGSTYGSLMLSPDGKHLFYAAESDDGYSRLWLVPTSGGAPVALFPRRDNYPVQWAADGTALLFIEGNAFQGEPTALYRARSDGTARLLIASGAVL